MKVDAIKFKGIFDSVVIDSFMLPFYNDNGIEINNDENLVEAIEKNKAYNQSIARLRINICGECSCKINSKKELDLVKFRDKDLGLKRSTVGDKIRYYICYIDIYIIKSDNLLPKLVEDNSKNFKAVNHITKNNYELAIIYAATELQKKIQKETKEYNDCNIAVLDKIYVHPQFRRLGIATWVHENFSELIKLTSTIDIVASMLVPGDFSEEAESEFGMTSEQYKKFLINSYKNMGYKNYDFTIMYKRFIPKKNIFHFI